MEVANADEKRVDECPDRRAVGVNASDDLGDDNEPCVYAHVPKAFPECRLNILRRAVIEPQSKESKNILESVTKKKSRN